MKMLYLFFTSVNINVCVVCVIVSVRPVAQLVERRTPGGESPGSRRFGARYIVLLTGMACGRWQRPQPVEVSEWGGPCPAMWAR